MRPLFSIYFICLSVIYPLTAMAEEEKPLSLRSQVQIDGPHITLADLFQGITENGDVTIADSPPPGGSLTLDSRFLQSLARAYQLNWRALSRNISSTITRSYKEVRPVDFVAALQSTLEKLPDMPARFNLDLADQNLHAYLPVDQKADIQVEILRWVPSSHEFRASFLIPSNQGPIFRREVKGYILPAISLPVPNQPIAKGTIITEAMIETIDWPVSRLPNDVLTKSGEIVGQMAERTIKPQQLFRSGDVSNVPLIKRGDIVLISFVQGALHLTARARALEDGYLNANIRLTNLASKKPISGIVKAPGLVNLEISQ